MSKIFTRLHKNDIMYLKEVIYMKKIDIAILLYFKRKELNELINLKKELTDKEIVDKSKEIDELLNKYV